MGRKTWRKTAIDSSEGRKTEIKGKHSKLKKLGDGIELKYSNYKNASGQRVKSLRLEYKIS